ncbi:MAG: hypothetical protein MI919_28235, partial [Holophagales bacterium]|nr:hypothetical protein [Holophagales bacterium]
MGAPRAAEDPAAIQMGAEQKRLESGTADPSDADPGATGPGKPEPDNRAIPTWAYWLGIIFGIGTLLFLYRHLGAVADGRSGEPLRTLVQEYVAACGAGLLFFPLRALVRRWPPRWQRLPLYALVFLGFSFIHTTWNWGVRNLVYLAFGWGAYDYGRMPVRYLMELPIDVLSLTLMAVGILGWDGLQRARARELRSAQLESRLARAQVHNL